MEKGGLVHTRCRYRWEPMCKNMNLDTDLMSFTKVKSTWIIDLKVKCKTMNLLEDNIQENLK